MRRRREFLPDTYVIARMLHALRQGPLPRSRVAAAALVNYKRFELYLRYLAERDYVRDGLVTSLTPRGAEIAAALEELLREILSADGPFSKKRR
jgi:predicted transcriptional regulator